QLVWSPTTGISRYDYGTVHDYEHPSQTFVLTNSGGCASGPLTVSLSGSAAFTLTKDEDCAGKSLGPGNTCIVIVQYAPTGTGAASAALTAVAATTSSSIALTGSGVPFTNWPMFRGSPTHAAWNTSDTAPQSLPVKWRVKTGGPVESSPAVVNGIVFVGSDS